MASRGKRTDEKSSAIQAFWNEDETDPNTSLPQRVAKFLLWARDRPETQYVFFDYEDISKAVHSTRKPTPNEVAAIRNAIEGAKKFLLKNHATPVYSKRGVGYRVPVNSNDIVSTVLPAAQQRLESAAVKVNSVLQTVDPKQLTQVNREYYEAVRPQPNKILGDESGYERLKRLQAAAVKGALPGKLKS